MAKIYSHSESRARGSVGMTTYRYVKGRVIQSQKIAPWDPAVEAVGAATRWNRRTALLGLISLFCSVHSESIKNSFNRSKRGSQRNYFMKRNYSALSRALANLADQYALTRVVPSIITIEDAIGSYAASNPTSIYRIKKTGYDVMFLTGNWDDADDPAAATLIDSMEATLNSDFEITVINITGSNLSQSIKLSLGGSNLDGTLVIASDKSSATFTPASASVVIGTQTLVARIGSVIKAQAEIQGDSRVYYTLALSVQPAGGGNVTGGGRFVAGTAVPISATPSPEYEFLRWSDDDTNASRTVVVSQNMTLTAIFQYTGSDD